MSTFLPDTLKYTSWSEDNEDSHFTSDDQLAQEGRSNDATTAHAKNGDRNDATHRFDRLARGLRISDQLSGLNDMEKPFPPYANVYHLSQDDMNLGSAHAYDNRNDASTRRFSRPSRRPRISEDLLTGLNEPFPRYANVYHLSQDDMNLGSTHSNGDGNEATRPFSRSVSEDQLTGFNDMKLDTSDERNSLHGSLSSEHAATRRVQGAIVFGDCTFSVDSSGLLTRYGSCPTQSGDLRLSGMSIKALSPDVFSDLPSAR